MVLWSVGLWFIVFRCRVGERYGHWSHELHILTRPHIQHFGFFFVISYTWLKAGFYFIAWNSLPLPIKPRLCIIHKSSINVGHIQRYCYCLSLKGSVFLLWMGDTHKSSFAIALDLWQAIQFCGIFVLFFLL